MAGSRPSHWSLNDLALGDLIGGLSLAGLLVPEAIAYSAIAGLPSSFGITAAVVGPLAYALIGRSRLAVVSATSGAAALLAAASSSAAIPNATRADVAIALTVLVGVFFLLGAALRIASLTSFISRAVLHGFGFGLAVTISLRQLPALLGLSSVGGTSWQTLCSVVARFGQIHLPSFFLGVAALIFLGLCRRLRFAPAGLLLIAATTLIMGLGANAHLGIATAGNVVFETTAPHVPALSIKDWLRLAQFGFPIAVVILAESWATIRSLASLRGDTVSPGREIASLGLANVASGFLRGLPVGAGFSIGNANAQAGTIHRIGALIGAAGVAFVALSASRWIALIPEPVLAAIVISALAHALSPSRLLKKLPSLRSL